MKNAPVGAFSAEDAWIMSLQPGQSLGPYKVATLLGEGGMGQVWQATDTQLNRDVALKILPDAFASDPDRLARFKREAQILASLNHPNIAQIHGIEEAEGTRALVLELVEGPTLADRIAQGPIPIDEALPIAKQIAEALEAAHEQGVIHRDLKPANVKVKADGTVKVLDFGLAKALQPVASDPNMSMSPTVSLTAAATQMGMVIGTAAYMAPEQAKGKVVDKRADVWAFGAVLYEMLAGAKPFPGGDVSEVLATVIKTDPDWDVLPDETPPRVRTLLRRCLEKDPKQRVHDVADVRLAMAGAFESAISAADATTVPPALARWQRPVPLALIGLALMLVGALSVWRLVPTAPPSPEPRRFTLTLPDTDRLQGGGSRPALSPDGRTLVYRALRDGGARAQLFRRPIDQFEATPMAGTEGASEPFFSPDGQWVGFQASRRLQKVALAGGPPQTLAEDPGFFRGADWGTDELIVFGVGAPGGALMQIPAAGGAPTPLFTPEGQRRPSYLQVLPGSDAVLFTLTDQAGAGELHLLRRDTGEHRIIVPDAVAGRVLSTGHLVFVRSGALWAVPFDRAALEIAGTPAPVVEGVRVMRGGAVLYATADDGSLVYVPGTAGTDARSLVWVDRGGQEELLTLPARDYDTLSLSPDGTRAAVVAGGDDGNVDVWVSELARGTLTRLTTRPGVDTYPLWSPDGQRVVFMSTEDGRVTLYQQAADGSGTPERLLTDETMTDLVPYDWSPDGETLFLTGVSPDTDRDVGMVASDGSGTWTPLVQTPARDLAPAISPDGRWLAYASNESGLYEVYVQRFPEMLGRQQVSVGTGHRPHWSDDGRELFYLRAPTGPPRAVVRVTVEPTDSDPPALDFGTEEVLFDWRYHQRSSAMPFYDLSPDGRFLMITTGDAAGDGSGRAEIHVVLDWFEELRRLVPVP